MPWSQAAPLRPLGEKAHVKKHKAAKTKSSYRRGIRLAQKFWVGMRGAPSPRWAGHILKGAAGPCCCPTFPYGPREGQARGWMVGPAAPAPSRPRRAPPPRPGPLGQGRPPWGPPRALQDAPGWADTRRVAAALHPHGSAYQTSLALKRNETKLQPGKRQSKEVCGFFSSCAEPVLGARGKGLSGHTDAARETHHE